MELNWYFWHHQGQEAPADKWVTHRWQLRLKEALHPEHVSSLVSPGLQPEDRDFILCLACAGPMTFMRERPGRGLECLHISL